MKIKRVYISPKGEITIPQEFLNMLEFEETAECIVCGDELIIRPLRRNKAEKFAELLPLDLILQEYSIKSNDIGIYFEKTQKGRYLNAETTEEGGEKHWH